MPSMHTSREFESELRELRGHLLAMGARCERIVRVALEVFASGELEREGEVRAIDARIDRDQMEIDAMALRILALRQPVAHDLRLLATTFKLVTDLERIGDEAVNITERAGEVERDATPFPQPHLATMGMLTQQMLRDALDAFVDADAARAERVLAADDDVDALYGRTRRETVELLAEAPARLRTGMAVVAAAKCLERIADHATNVAEEVIFMVRGDDVRHGGGQPQAERP